MLRLIIMLLCGVCYVQSTHFRGGIIMARPQPGGSEYEIEVSYRVSWRRSYRFISISHFCDSNIIDSGVLQRGQGNLECQYGCSGRITPMSYICTDFSTEEDWTFGEGRFAHNFTSTDEDVVTVGFTGRNWIAPFSSDWNISVTFSLTTRNDTGRINSSPRAITAPIIRLQEGCNHTIVLAVNDPDGDVVQCRWAEGVECAGICNQLPGAELNSTTCTIQYPANQGARIWAAALMIEDFVSWSEQPLSSVALQFLVLVVESSEPCSQAPAFINPTISQGSCVAVPPGTTFATQLVASSGGSSVSIAEIQTVSPLGTRRGELQHVLDTGIYYLNITWTPSSSQINDTQLFCFTAVNSVGVASEQNCIQLLAGAYSPMPILETAVPNQESVHPSNTTWSVTFNSGIKRPSISSFITIHEFSSEEEVYRIDSSSSDEVVFSNTKLHITPMHKFAEKQTYFINFDRGIVQGLTACGPGNEPVRNKYYWTFETIDVTPPLIVFIESPVVSRSNLTLSWESNENVTWECSLEKDSISSTVDCSEAHWGGYNLDEGVYNLRITATDTSSNVATEVHTFEIDQTPPITTIMLKPSPLSSEQTPTLRFTCDEVMCSFECQLNSLTYQGSISSCDSGFFVTSALQHNTTYTFIVIAIDQVGNQGEPTMFMWETDFESPSIYGVDEYLAAPCSMTSPEYTGFAMAEDETSGIASVMYSDSNLGCSTERTWTAIDRAGNTGHLIQTIDFEFSPTLSLIPQVTLPCDSTSNSFQIPTDTAIAPNLCNLPLQLTYTDSVREYTCPSSFMRNWFVSVCGKNASASQNVVLYNLCPSHACGRNESLPRGICSLGECQCNRPWYGEDCTNLIHTPLAEHVNNTVLQEAQMYDTTITLTQGTPPLSWTLLSGPAQLTVDQYTGLITWSRAQVGNYTVTVQIENQVDKAAISWCLQVNPGYSAFLLPITQMLYPQARAITLSGYIKYTNDSGFLQNPLPVSIDITVSNGAVRTLLAFTDSNGFFNETFHPTATEYGTYTAHARHPDLPSETVPQVEWLVLGFKPSARRVVLEGEAVREFEKTFYNVTILCNDGPEELHEVIATPLLPSSQDITVKVFLKRTLTSITMEPGDTVSVDIKVSVSRPLNRLFPVRFESSNGTALQIIVNIYIAQILPSFQISSSSVSTRVIRGRSRILEFRVQNVGSATANNVQAILPTTNFISFVSFGNPNLNEGNLKLETGESAVLSILVRIPPTQELGELSGSVAITSTEVSSTIPIAITVSSDLLTNLTVSVEDEYTYFASGQPLVSNAAVTLINYQRSVRTTKTTEQDNGTATFINIHEDMYELYVEAPDHQPLRQIIVVSVDNPQLTVFIERQTVRYTWSVTPVTFQDSYVLRIEADFETHVPIPVVTIFPTEINLEDLELGLITSFQMNITNHGLIRANDLTLSLPNNHPFLLFSTDREELGNLNALSSFIVSVRVLTKSIQKRSSGSSCAHYPVSVRYTFVCGTLQVRSAQLSITNRVSRCTGRIRRRGSGGQGRLGGSFVSSTRLPCSTRCLKTILLSCATLLLPLPPPAGCIILVVTQMDPLESLLNALSWIQCGVEIVFPVASKYTGLGVCLYSVYEECLNIPRVKREKRDLESSLVELVESLYPIQQSFDLGVEVLGDETWMYNVEDPTWLTNILLPALDDNSEMGVLISNAELDAITTVPPPNGTTVEKVSKMVLRVNNTLHGWNSGQLEPEDGSNMASYSLVQELTERINTYNDIAIRKGFSSYLDAYSFFSSDVSQNARLEVEEGVCAIVRIRIEQELALTREAFLAKLEIENQDTSPLEQIVIEIFIVATNTGEQANHLFSVGNSTGSSSLRSSDGGYMLPNGMSGTIEWLIIPHSEAAPEADQDYDVGGTIMYVLEGENITVPLFPSAITVRPDPSLLVHYFWERYVIGDDPFTDEVEPSVPFTLGVAVKNAGYGIASSLQIASGEPEIIENEKGLLVNFMIIGANVNGGEVSPSLTVTFGDLAPNTTTVARWLMVSSLQGEFMNYSATFENVNPLGDSQLSILDELEIHELIRNVLIYADPDEDDGVLDFLVNERNDFFAYPDALYSSKSLQRYSVNAGTVFSVRTLDTATSLEVRVTSNSTGWVYFRYVDVQNFLGEPASAVNGTKWELNETIFIPPVNAWITRDRRNTEVLSLHILDYLQTTGEVFFILSLCMSDCPTVEVPFTRSIVSSTTSQPAQTLVPMATATTTTLQNFVSTATAGVTVQPTPIVSTVQSIVPTTVNKTSNRASTIQQLSAITLILALSAVIVLK